MGNYQKVEIRPEETTADKPEVVEDVGKVEQEVSEDIQPETPVTEQRPEWLPEKFESPEALAFAYAQLEKKLSQPAAEEPQEVTKNVGITEDQWDQLSEEFDTTGDVSEASREALVKQGIPRHFIDAFVEGQKSALESAITAGYEAAGGKDKYVAMTKWAASALNDSEISTFNEMINGNQEEMKLAIDGLRARYEKAVPNETRSPLVQGETGSVPNSAAFQSRAQVVEAMSDPRYRKDSAYRDEVYRKLQNSNVL